jgi:hypothetical protein
MTFHVEQAKLEHREQTHRPCPDNENVRFDRIGHALRPVGKRCETA